MAQEIERKFLVASDGWRAGAEPGQRLEQAYLVQEGDRNLRVRIAGGSEARLTFKVGSGMTRGEFEYPIPIDDGRTLLGRGLGARIEKTRYRVPWKGHVWEVDVFEGALAGLIIAEVELGSEDEMPVLPEWLGREVTDDTAYTNAALARHGLAADRSR